MPSRKTINVDRVRELANRMLRESVDEVTEGREGVYVLLEEILMETGNYKSYDYLPGVMDFTTDPPSGDDTRRHYY